MQGCLSVYMSTCACSRKVHLKKAHIAALIDLQDSEKLVHTVCYVIYSNFTAAAATAKATAI